MKVRIQRSDIDAVIRSLEREGVEILKTHEQIAKTACGQLATELASATNPPFFGENLPGTAGFRWNVMREVDNAFPARGGWYAHLTTIKGKDFASRWWALQQINEAAAEIFLQKEGIDIHRIEINRENHRQMRGGKKGHVQFRWDGRYIEESQMPEREEYAKRKAANVGLGKAGWLAAGKAAAGSSRVGGKDVGWVRALVKKASGFGTMKADAKGFEIELTNGMQYAEWAENPQLMKRVKDLTFQRIGRYLEKMVKEMAKRNKMSGG